MNSSRRRGQRALAATAVAVLLGGLAAPAFADDRSEPHVPGADAPTSTASEPRPGASTPVLAQVDGAGTVVAPSARSGDVTARAASVPQAPAEALVTSVTSTEAFFEWTAPADGGSAITGYIVRLSIRGQVILEGEWPSTALRIYDLDPETEYEFSVAAVNALGTGAFSQPTTFATPYDFVERQFGPDRYATSARVSYRAFPYSGIEAAFVANGVKFPDALAAAAAAGAMGGPVLLTRPTVMSDPIAWELEALAPNYSVISGGPASVSVAVEARAGSYASSGAVRLAGADRYATAAAVSTIWDSVDTVYLASGENFPDALAGAAAAGSAESPVLLTKKGILPPATAQALARLKPSRIVVLGGIGSVTEATAKAAKAATTVPTTLERWSGDTRFTTAVDVSRRAFPTPGVPVVYIANGMTFADALSGAAAAGSRGGPVLLTRQNALSPEAVNELTRLQPERVVVLGGPAIVSDHVIQQIEAATGH